MLRRLLFIAAVWLSLIAFSATAAHQTPKRPTPKATTFGVAAHDNVAIEWWYVNAHVTTEKGRHLALIGSFFRFGNGLSPFTGSPMARAHYLIYAVTDLDKKTQRSYSLADSQMVAILHQLAPLMATMNPNDKAAQLLASSLNAGKLPPGHLEIAGTPTIDSKKFRIAYGTENTLTATDATNKNFDITLDAGGSDKIHLTLASQKPAMAVGGKGETGLDTPTDMYYFSLTRCRVDGTIDTGAGPEKIVGGDGWFDHQWGNSWVAKNDGWDWWGVQLTDGTDILFFRQRDLATGKVFFPLATFMDKSGHQSVTKKIVFTPDPKSVWKSDKTDTKYPLGWTVTFPEQNLKLQITAAALNQEMPILGPGGAIWEGSCNVLATSIKKQNAKKTIQGTAYMELVGYNSPAVKARVAQGK